MQDINPDVSTWKTQLRRGSLELAVLLVLEKQRRYGLELVDLLNQAGLGISEGAIYPLLSRLRADGKVTAEWVDEGVGHAHKYYDLTELGRASLAAMREAWRELTTAFDRLTAIDTKDAR